jgi:hypothetical protein
LWLCPRKIGSIRFGVIIILTYISIG